VASDRIIIVRVYGIGGFTNLADGLTLTSRAGLAYLPNTTINGVVAEMGTQFSSEIPVFGSMGSDPTTTFSVLSIPETLSIMLSRTSNYLRNSSNNGIVRTSFYVDPDPAATIYCDDTTYLAEDDIVRISGSTFLVTGIVSLLRFDATRIWDSPNIPIAMQDQGTGQVIGSPIVLVRGGGTQYSRGGIEQLPVVISTAPVSATSKADEEVIFRGMVSKVSTDTSAGGSNQIKVTCSSIMGMIRNTPFRPAAMSVYFLSDPDRYGGRAVNYGPGRLQVNYRADVSGPLWNWLEGPYKTRVGVVQLRKDSTGGIYKVDQVFDQGNGIDYTLQASGNSGRIGGEERDYNLNVPVFFNDGVYANTIGGEVVVNTGIGQGSGTPPNGSFLNQYQSNGRSVLGWFAETCFVGNSADFGMNAVIDLLFGTFNADTTGAEGVRSVGMSAWLPFGWDNIEDIVDLGELNSVLGDDINQAMPILDSEYKPWPYKHAAAKTVGDVLDWVLKRTGSYMVYDRGRLRFNRWTTPGVWPTEVDDAGLAEPTISLNFDRNNSIQTAEIDWAKSILDKDITREKYRVSNADALLTSSGKIVTLGNFVVPYGSSTELANSQAMRDAVNLVTRFSKAAAIVEVTYRDDVYDLEVGQFIAFSSEFVPSAQGTMGVLNATGYVLKAARAWKTPTTTYTLFLYGYLTAGNRISLVSASGRVRSVIDDYTIKLDTNVYTPPVALARPGAPVSDCAAFEETRARYGGKLALQLLDEYGTPYFIEAGLISVDVPNDTLTFDSDIFKDAKVGDVIVIAPSISLAPDKVAKMYDATQADGLGQVLGDEALSYPWMV
jgi:hypothetical protein